MSLEQGLPHSLVTRMLLNDHYLAASVSDTGQASAAPPDLNDVFQHLPALRIAPGFPAPGQLPDLSAARA